MRMNVVVNVPGHWVTWNVTLGIEMRNEARSAKTSFAKRSACTKMNVGINGCRDRKGLTKKIDVRRLLVFAAFRIVT